MTHNPKKLTPKHPSMDWFSWLSKTNLDPSLVYEYGLAFARNELQSEDKPYLNHEILQSMGISVAKHRLEILKLAKKEAGNPKPLSGLITAINKTKKSFGKYLTRLVSNEDASQKGEQEPVKKWRGTLSWKHDKSEKDEKTFVYKTRNVALSGPLDGRTQERLLLTHRSPKLSGPLDGRVQFHYTKPQNLYAPRSPALSGPLEKRIPEKVIYPTRSPKLSGPLDGGGVPCRAVFGSRSPRLSGPIEVPMPPSPKVYSDYNKENMDAYEEHSLWAKLFLDMKPT